MHANDSAHTYEAGRPDRPKEIRFRCDGKDMVGSFLTMSYTRSAQPRHLYRLHAEKAVVACQIRVPDDVAGILA